MSTFDSEYSLAHIAKLTQISTCKHLYVNYQRVTVRKYINCAKTEI